ncbi:MAG TPA: GNAT family N-acetyltransferase [Acidimicrobiales bacterium]|nr:GNAT family N-acetyltransferase [Acidimicrobiales bacterium]
MDQLVLEPITSEDFERLKSKVIKEFASEQVRAGNWHERDAMRLAAEQTDVILPQGLATPGTLILHARTHEGTRVGHVWISLEPQGHASGEAWIYDIEVDEPMRGRGYGRLLLEAAERAALASGATALGLNVFGANHVARTLYEHSGYEVQTLQMRKMLTARQ